MNRRVSLLLLLTTIIDGYEWQIWSNCLYSRFMAVGWRRRHSSSPPSNDWLSVLLGWVTFTVDCYEFSFYPQLENICSSFRWSHQSHLTPQQKKSFWNNSAWSSVNVWAAKRERSLEDYVTHCRNMKMQIECSGRFVGIIKNEQIFNIRTAFVASSLAEWGCERSWVIYGTKQFSRFCRTQPSKLSATRVATPIMMLFCSLSCHITESHKQND